MKQVEVMKRCKVFFSNIDTVSIHDMKKIRHSDVKMNTIAAYKLKNNKSI